MNRDQRTFDELLAAERKADGMKSAADSHEDVLTIARRIARHVAMARPDRTASADDVQEGLIEQGYEPADLGNAAGSVFRGPWEPVGYVASTRVSNHGRMIRVWRLID